MSGMMKPSGPFVIFPSSFVWFRYRNAHNTSRCLPRVPSTPIRAISLSDGVPSAFCRSRGIWRACALEKVVLDRRTSIGCRILGWQDRNERGGRHADRSAAASRVIGRAEVGGSATGFRRSPTVRLPPYGRPSRCQAYHDDGRGAT
jgi:hypothetical protein